MCCGMQLFKFELGRIPTCGFSHLPRPLKGFAGSCPGQKRSPNCLVDAFQFRQDYSCIAFVHPPPQMFV